MIGLLAEAAANNAAKEGSPVGAVFVVLVILLLLIALLAHAFGQRGAGQQSPTFDAITPGDNALLPPVGGSGAPVTGEVHVNRMIVVAPKADTGSQQLRN